MGKHLKIIAIILVLFTMIAIVTIFSLEEKTPLEELNGKIVFVSDRDGNQEIYLMQATGANQSRLTNGYNISDCSTCSPSAEDYPSWSH